LSYRPGGEGLCRGGAGRSSRSSDRIGFRVREDNPGPLGQEDELAADGRVGGRGEAFSGRRGRGARRGVQEKRGTGSENRGTREGDSEEETPFWRTGPPGGREERGTG